ncbi:MAG: hypothetical protein AB7N71_09495 [Phycisphaerae bacterium]
MPRNIAILCCLAVGFPAWSDEKPLPPPPSGAIPQLVVPPKNCDFSKLVQLWDKAGSPPLFVLCGVNVGIVDRWSTESISLTNSGRSVDSAGVTIRGGEEAATSSGPRRIEGELTPFRHLQRNMTCDDANGFTSSITAGIQEQLLDAGIERVILPDALVQARTRLVDSYRAGEEQVALESIFSELPAAFVLYVRMYPLEPDRSAGTKSEPMVRVRLSLILAGSGDTGGTDFFDIPAGISARHVTGYTREICCSFNKLLTRHFERRFGRGGLVQIKFQDSNLKQLRAIGEAMEASVPEFVALNPSASRVVRGRNITDVTIRFRGSAFDLYSSMGEILPETLGLSPQLVDSVDGSLTITMVQLPEKRDPGKMARWEILMSEDDPRREALLAQFTSEYRDEQRPRIAVLVNREVLEADLDGEAGERLKLDAEKNGYRSMRGYTTFSRLANSRDMDGQALDTAAMTEALRIELLRYGLNVVDAEHARARIAKEANVHGEILNDTEIERVIRELDTAELFLRCTGRRQDSNPPKYSFTFNILRNADAGIPASALDSILASDFTGDQHPLQRLAKQATAKMVDQLWADWSPPRRIHVMVTHARAEDDVLAVMDAMRLKIRSGIRATEFKGMSGVGEARVGQFDIEWDGEFNELVKNIQDRKDVLPFSLHGTNTSANSLTIRVRDQLTMASAGS